MFANTAALLGLGTIIYILTIGATSHWDRRLIRIYDAGLILSLLGIVCSLAGVWRKSLLRWHSPVVSLGVFLFWILAMMPD